MPRLEGVLRELQKKKNHQTISVEVDQSELMGVIDRIKDQIRELNESIAGVSSALQQAVSDGMQKAANASDGIAKSIPSAQSIASLVDLKPIIKLLGMHSELLMELSAHEAPKQEPVDLAPVLQSIRAIDIPVPKEPIPPKEEWRFRVVERDKNGKIEEAIFD